MVMVELGTWGNVGGSAMSIRLDKPWQPLTAAVPLLRGNLGVFQLADSTRTVLYIGFAGGRSLFGLRGAVTELAAQIPDAELVRWEVNTAYQSRFRELLWLHRCDTGALPHYNDALGHRPARLGRLSPA